MKLASFFITGLLLLGLGSAAGRRESSPRANNRSRNLKATTQKTKSPSSNGKGGSKTKSPSNKKGSGKSATKGDEICSAEAPDFTPCAERGPKNLDRAGAKICPGYSRCGCVAGPGGFLECLSGGVTERCLQCTKVKDCKKSFDKDGDDFCGCYDANGIEQDCVAFNFPDDCATACTNGRGIPSGWRDACLCHFVTELGCSADKCLESQVFGDLCVNENKDCACFCQSFFADHGGPHANCLQRSSWNDTGVEANLLNCPNEGIRFVNRNQPDCGNGIIEEGEHCDGRNFNGKSCSTEITCPDGYYATGSLGECVNCNWIDTTTRDCACVMIP